MEIEKINLKPEKVDVLNIKNNKSSFFQKYFWVKNENSFIIENSNREKYPLFNLHTLKGETKNQLQKNSFQDKNSSAIFLWPFFVELFEELKIIDEDFNFFSMISQQRAAHIITYISSKSFFNLEWDCLFGKIFSGMEFSSFLPNKYPLHSGILPSWLCEKSSSWDENYKNQKKVSSEEKNVYEEIIKLRKIILEWKTRSLQRWSEDIDLDLSEDDSLENFWNYLSERTFILTEIDELSWHIQIPVLNNDRPEIVPSWLSDNIEISFPWSEKKIIFSWM